MEFKLCVFSPDSLAEVVEQQVEGILHEPAQVAGQHLFPTR